MTELMHYPVTVFVIGIIVGGLLTLSVLAFRRDLRDVDRAMKETHPVKDWGCMQKDFGLLAPKGSRPTIPPPAPPPMRTGCPARRHCPCDQTRRGDRNVPT